MPLLFLSFTLMAQNIGQLYNEGKLYVSPQTLLTSESDFINSEDGWYSNNGEVLLKGNFHNDGIAGFEIDGGITRFEGVDFQMISGSLPVDYYNVLFNNTSDDYAFGLSGDMYIFGEVNFDQGIVDNDQYGGVMLFEPSSDHFNTSDESYVEGIVDKIGEETFIYPVGKEKYYRPATTILENGQSAHFSTEYLLENSDTDYSHELSEGIIKLIDNQEYWTINASEGADQEAFVTLTWRSETTPQEIIAGANSDDYKLVVVRWDEAQNMWVNQGGVTDIDNRTVTSNAVSGFGVFTLGLIDKDKVLPCDVAIYNAVTPNGDGLNDYFRIENEGDCARDFRVKIFNRWGVRVFATDDYSENGEMFYGYSNGRATIDDKKQLPTGTYFYILEYDYQTGNDQIKTEKKAGYLYLSGSEGN